MSKDKVVRNIEVYETTDYDKFSLIVGNRAVDKSHLHTVQRSFEKNGNRLLDDPIEVNDKYQILDGQHRFNAAKAQKFPVCYYFSEKESIQDVRIANTNRRNWGWLDYATSYRDKDNNQDYKQFLEFYEQFRLPFRALLMYCGLGDSHTAMTDFNAGDFLMDNYKHSREQLEIYQDIADKAGIHNQQLATATYKFIQQPNYDHSKMLTNLTSYRRELTKCIFVNEYLFTLQDIYKQA